MKARQLISSVCLIVLILSSLGAVQAAAASAPPPPSDSPDLQELAPTPDSGVVSQAVQEAILTRDDIPGFQINEIAIDHIQYSQEQAAALVFLTAIDPETQQPIPREPGLAIAQRSLSAMDASSPAAWDVTFQADASWQQTFESLPPDLLTEDLRQRFLPVQEEIATTGSLTLGGYLLPWAGGQTKSLSWSVGHKSCANNDCLYAFDFYDGTMFPLLAAKGGIVFGARWDVPNGYEQATNYLVLQDNSTNPVSYQIYYHMAQNTLPEALRVKGTPVSQGQYIGNVDDTGYSTGHHLHFMVTTSSYGLWGPSVDITFRDVSINYDPVTQGGRPRLPNEAEWYGGQGQEKYTSGNYGTQPPQGGITAPNNWLDLSSSIVRVEGWGSDDLGVTKAQLLVNYGGGWRTAGTPAAFSPAKTSVTFAMDVNLCNEGVQDGPVSLSVRLWDVEGNQTNQPLGTRQIFKHSGCAGGTLSTLCNPGSNQVALFSQPYYQGYCQNFPVGDYPNDLALGNIGENAAASVLVGKNVFVTLYQDANLSGRAETFSVPDPNLADHRIQAGTISSLRVQYKGAKAELPGIIPLGALTADDSVVLGFINRGGIENLAAQLSGPLNKDFGPDRSVSWSLGNLPAGPYTLKAWDGSGSSSDATSLSFSVAPGTAATPPAVAFPYTADFDTSGTSGWTSSGAWAPASVQDRNNQATNAWGFNLNGTCQNGSLCRGDLTSPPIKIPAGQTAYLRFDYLWNGEDSPSHWDQRNVQIAASDSPTGPFTFSDLYSQWNDQPGVWLSSTLMSGQNWLNLAAYQGKYVRIRFGFQSVDGQSNAKSSWVIDNFSLTTTPPETPADNNFNATNAGSLLISLGQTIEGVISPNGDMDYYHFYANPGEIYQVDVTTKWDGSTSILDPTVAIVDWDQISYLAQNDDIEPGVDTDARVSFRAQKIDTQVGNTYYIRVKAFDYPTGDTNRSYRITLTRLTDISKPTLSVQLNTHNNFMPPAPFTIQAQAGDDGPGGVKSVDFYLHRNDWENGHWVSLDGENEGNGKYELKINPGFLTEGIGYSIWVRAVDWALNYTDQVFWNLGYDPTPPVSALSPLPATVPGNTIRLNINTVELTSGIDHCDVMFQDNGGDWQFLPRPDGNNGCQDWFYGEFGHTYAFLTHAVDRAGNEEAFPSSPESIVQLTDPGQGDAFESDNTPEAARPVQVDGDAQLHDFYGIGDTDWVSFQAEAGKQYYILAQPQNGGPAGVQLSLSLPGSGPTVAAIQSSQLGSPITLSWKATQSGTVYIQIRSIDERIAGSNASYTIQVVTAFKSYMPIINR